jgi:DNA-binding MarR family transcriptional regulator
MTNRIDRLETRGLVRRTPDRSDRRGVNVSLTAKGMRLIDRAIQHRLESARDSLQALTAAQQHELAQLLRSAVLAAPDAG